MSIYFSVLNRKSGSPDLGGHYWSYIRDHKSGAWFKFNDVAVNRVEQVDVRFLKHLVWWCFLMLFAGDVSSKLWRNRRKHFSVRLLCVLLWFWFENCCRYALMYVRDIGTEPIAWNTGQGIPLWARDVVSVRPSVPSFCWCAR